MDRAFDEKNKASTERLKALAKRLSDKDMSRNTAAGWTVAVTLAHLAFWDERVLLTLTRTEKEGKLSPVELDVVANDLMLPVLQLIPGHDAARLAIEKAELLDKRLAGFPEGLLEQVNAHNPRWVTRALHRNEHMDEMEAALNG